MLKQIGLVWIVAFVALLAAADAQTPQPSTAGAVFDGTYRLVSIGEGQSNVHDEESAGGPMSGPQTGAAHRHAGSGAV